MSKKIKVGDCFHFGVFMMVCDKIEDGIAYFLDDEGGKHYMLQVADIPIPTLHLPIGNDPNKYGGAWFDMILRGEKEEEYREFSGYNLSRLCSEGRLFQEWTSGVKDVVVANETFKAWRVLHITNGYGHDKPQLWAHIKEITLGRGNPEWGAPADRDVFIIRLGDVFHTKNLKK